MSPLCSIGSLTSILRKCKTASSPVHMLCLRGFLSQNSPRHHILLQNRTNSLFLEIGEEHNSLQKILDKSVFQNECSYDSVFRNEWSCNSLILTQVKRGEFSQALTLYTQMQECSMIPGMYTVAALLKSCAGLRDVQNGYLIHQKAVSRGLLEIDMFIGNSLVDMYMKCGFLGEAQVVFDKLQTQDVVSWNIIITGYVNHNCFEEALKNFDQMERSGVSPNSVTFICILKACGSTGDLNKAHQIENKIVNQTWLQRDIAVGNAMIEMYTKCGAVVQAQRVFDLLEVRDVVSWNSLIGGYVRFEYHKEALDSFEHMLLEGIPPDPVTLLFALQACGGSCELDKGEEIHAEIVRKGLLGKDIIVTNCLVDMYATCGSITKANDVFDTLLVRTVVSWTVLISGYAKHELGNEALHSFEQMQLECVFPNSLTYVSSLNACGAIGAERKGHEIHTSVAAAGLLEKNVLVGNALLDMYSKCGSITQTEDLFNHIPVRDVFSWNVLIAGYAKQECGKEALICLERMYLEGLYPDIVTFDSCLKACSQVGAIRKGRHIHNDIYMKDLLCKDNYIGNALVHMYAKCGSFKEANRLFDKLTVHSVVSWSSLMSGYGEKQMVDEVINCFERMQLEGIPPDDVTLVYFLKACGRVGAVNKGSEIFVDICRTQKMNRNFILGSALSNMYIQCGWLKEAQEVFDKLLIQDVTAWTTLLAGCAKHNYGNTALSYFLQMESQGISADSITFLCTLKACGDVGAINIGTEVYNEIIRRGLIDNNSILANAVINMYAKCGSLRKAEEVFDKLPVQDVSSWNVLLKGYARRGEINNVFNLFERMTREGKVPDVITFNGILHACISGGLVYNGLEYFSSMVRDYNMQPTLEHITGMAHLHSRSGHLEMARMIIGEMAPNPDFVVWQILLDACENFGNVDFGRECFKQALKPHNSLKVIF